MPRFGELEAAIMDVVWTTATPTRVRGVVDALHADRQAAFTTVQTVMDILHRKGWLERAKDGRAYHYWAARSREEYTGQLLGEALETSSDRAAAITRLFDDLEPGEIQDLQRALDQAKDREAMN